MHGAWTGPEWDAYCVQLVRQRWSLIAPHTFQTVPSNVQVTLGFKGFSLNGHVYEWFAAEEPLSSDECARRQIEHLRNQLLKLRDNAGDLQQTLGHMTIGRFVFLVHRHDSSDLLAAVSAMTAEVRSWSLPGVASDFSIVVETAADYALEQEAVHGLPALELDSPPAKPEDAEAWGNENNDLRATAQTKLQNIIASDATVDGVLDALVGELLAGENSLEKIRLVSPETHAALLSRKAKQEARLVLNYSSVGASQATLTKISDEIGAELEACGALVDADLAQTLAWSSIADWLMRCPLDFAEPDE